jgi:hypothetical protein
MNFGPQNCGAVLRTSAHDQVRRGRSKIITFFQWVLVFAQSVNHARRPRWWPQIGAAATWLCQGLVVLDQDDRSQFADPGMEERLRGGNPLQLALQPEDLAGAYVFLSSRTNAKGITGTILTVDAGSMLRMPRRRQQNQ